MRVKLTNVLVDQCDYPSQPCSHEKPSYIEALAAKFKANGQQVPAIGWMTNGRFPLVECGCPVEAVRLAGFTHVLALDLGKEPTKAELFTVRTLIDLQQQHLTLADVARPFESIIATNGLSGKDLACATNSLIAEALFAPLAMILAVLGISAERIIAILADSANAIEQIATDLGLTAEDRRAATGNFHKEVEQRAPQMAGVLFIMAVLPLLGTRAFRYFMHDCGETRHDAEELSQSFVLKTLTALTGNWPRKNVGALLSEMRENLYVDHLRKKDRRARGLERLKKALQRIRK
jgi:hypothetical protein